MDGNNVALEFPLPRSRKSTLMDCKKVWAEEGGEEENRKSNGLRTPPGVVNVAPCVTKMMMVLAVTSILSYVRFRKVKDLLSISGLL
jgi:hypothetical protein